MIRTLLFVAACLVVLTCARRENRPAVLTTIVLASCILAPKTLIAPGSLQPTHVGIADSIPTLTTYYVAVLLALLYIMGRGRLRGVVGVAPFMTALLLGMVTWWEGNDEQWAGTLALLLAAIAWIVGRSVAPLINPDGAGGVVLSWALLVMSVIEAATALLQVAGLSIPFYALDPMAAALVAGRANGTTDHPDTLGKVLFLLLVLALPLTRLKKVRTRRNATLAVILGLIPLAASQGRANFIAVLATLALWGVMTRKVRWSRSRATIAISTTILAIASVGVYLARFQEDPTGGERDHFLEVAFRILPIYGRMGTGPNSYVDKVGQFDPLTAEGWPVHNSFLLALIELGVFVAVLSLIPILRTLQACIVRRLLRNVSGEYATVVIASIPGLALIAYTGWGLMAKQIVILMAFTYGLASGFVLRAERDEDLSHTLDGAREHSHSESSAAASREAGGLGTALGKVRNAG